MSFLKSMSGVRDITRGALPLRLVNMCTKKPLEESFHFEKVVEDAVAEARVAAPSSPEDVPDYVWWMKLCKACGSKVTSPYGGVLLRRRLVRSLAQRLALEDTWRLNRNEIERERVQEPIVVMGLPRSNGHLSAHVLSRSGYFLAPRQRDTLSPALMTEVDRIDAFRREFSGFRRLYPDFACVRTIDSEQIDDDLSLHLHTPYALAWGLLHGLDEFLLESLEEDQRGVFEHVKRTLCVFQWYRRCGHFSDCVLKEYNPIDNPMDEQTYGKKSVLLRQPWLLYSPFAILSMEQVHQVFPDMRLIWVHRALAQCLPSLCSSLALHNTVYTGKPPSDTQLATIGEKVMGLFGSGTEYTIDYLKSFDKERMAHWSNRDVKRHAARLATKTLAFHNIEVDRYRRMQMINAQSEYYGTFRPLHDAQLPYFGLHEGVVAQSFDSYIFQFEEFAHEERFGVVIQQYQPLANAEGQRALGALRVPCGGISANDSSFTEGQPMAGHFLQESKVYK